MSLPHPRHSRLWQSIWTGNREIIGSTPVARTRKFFFFEYACVTNTEETPHLVSIPRQNVHHHHRRQRLGWLGKQSIGTKYHGGHGRTAREMRQLDIQ